MSEVMVGYRGKCPPPVKFDLTLRSWGFPDGKKNLPANAGDMGSIPGSGRSPGEGHGNPLQYSCLGNPMDRGALWATVHGIAKELDMTEQLDQHLGL